MVWIWFVIGLILGGCQLDDPSAERHFYYGNYREALVGVVDDWEQPKTRTSAEQFLHDYGPRLMGALNQQLDQASRQTLVTNYLAACQTIVPLIARLPQSFLDQHPFPHRQRCADTQLAAVAQWRQSADAETDPLRELAIWEQIQTYDTLTSADTQRLGQLNQAVMRSIQLTWVWESPLVVDDLDAAIWMPRIHDGMPTAVMHHLQASDTPYYTQTPSADTHIRVTARVVQMDTMTEPVWAYDQLRFSKIDHGVARWYTHDFQYRVYDRDYTLQAVGHVDVYHLGARIARIPLNEQVSQTRELGDPTIDLPINYRDIQFPADYQLRIQARIQVDSDALLAQLQDQVYAAVAVAINEAVF